MLTNKLKGKANKALSDHYSSWNNCKRCPLYKTNTNYVLARGEIPCQLLFIGEAPGVSEDATGYPFVGPAGKLLDKLLADTFEHANKKPTYAITNVIACIPWNEDQSSFRKPTKEEAEECYPRVEEFISICKPRLVVLLGKEASKYAPTSDEYATREIFHPSYLLRKGGASTKNLDYKRTMLKLSAFIQENL